MTDIEHASAIVHAFIAPQRQERYLTLLQTPRGRAKLRERFAHMHDLDKRFARAIPTATHAPRDIAKLLRSRGAPATCVLLAEDAALDGQQLPLDDALDAVVGRGMGAFISCLAGRLAYFEGEEAGYRYLLERAG